MGEISYTGKERIIQRIIEELNQLEGGSVEDVKVNGTSVVDADRIANVTTPTKLSDLTPDIIHFGTTAEWNAQPGLIGQAGHFYVYTDHDTVDGVDIPGLKMGTGNAYLIDCSFVDSNVSTVLTHISDTIAHVTQAEKDAWNAKVRCYVQNEASETIIFTTN